MIEPITAPITAVLCMLVPVLIGALYYENKRRKRIARRNSESVYYTHLDVYKRQDL